MLNAETELQALEIIRFERIRRKALSVQLNFGLFEIIREEGISEDGVKPSALSVQLNFTGLIKT
ncbi:hypothetical protein [Longitalea luteola]|uniref:hypothetical protein n=1 Tax=Longitalea luteola TaxID=2812563 RepID=UPI001A97A9E4|nr:hypothetical protein [Longitalea luteola]